MSPPAADQARQEPFRLARGGLIDRTARCAFRFDGQPLAGLAGDTLASALLANGVKLVGRSFKYHRPRGILTAGSEEPNALVELRSGARREPNTRATVAELYDGLEAWSQNRWPSLGLDLMAINGVLAPLIPAGFYYKTFMWPAAFWEKVYEPLIRRAAGLGRAAGAPDPDAYEKAHAHCDVLVIGAGPAGLAAALAAGRGGARVVLADEDFLPGGRLNAERLEIAREPAADWARRAAAELEAMPNVRLMRRTTVHTLLDHGTFAALERVADHLPEPAPHAPRQRAWRIVTRRAILASGAFERPLVFRDNDRPGVMLASAARSYLNRFAVSPGRRLVVVTSTDDGWRTAVDARDAGVAVAAVIDTRKGPLPTAAGGFTPVTGLVSGAMPTRVHGTRAVEAVEALDEAGRRVIVDCDAVAVSGGFAPAIGLACHLGHKPVWSEAIGAFLAGPLPAGLAVAGAAAGHYTTAECLASGDACGRAALVALGRPEPLARTYATSAEGAALAPSRPSPAIRGKAFVDFQNDVTTADVALAHREGYSSVELMKRYTTLGMATDQGKTSSLEGLEQLARLQARAPAEVGITTFRPPHTPIAIGALAGHHRGKDYRPIRRTPTHRWTVEQGAVLVESGWWLRAQWFPRAGERDWLESVTREVRTVRSAVGLCDVSTLGKLDIQGPDAITLLERVYVNGLRSLAVGRVRYGVMLREDGFVLDDGTIARLGPEHFLVTTTTANAARVHQHLELARQVLWPALDVQITPVTEQWAQLAVAGPRARDVLAAIVDRAHDLADAAVPYLAARDVTICGGLACRLFRISYSGELGFELAVPAGCADGVARALMTAGAPYGIAPYGTEAMAVMRIEKGHVAGNEINGQTTLADLGLGRMASPTKDYIGAVLARRPALVAPDRWRLMGFKPVDRSARLRAGAHFVPLGRTPTAADDQGYMTSVAFSPTLDHWIGLGLLARGHERAGERVRAYDPLRGGDIEVEIVSPVFVDPEGGRLRG